MKQGCPVEDLNRRSTHSEGKTQKGNTILEKKGPHQSNKKIRL